MAFKRPQLETLTGLHAPSADARALVSSTSKLPLDPTVAGRAEFDLKLTSSAKRLSPVPRRRDPRSGSLPDATATSWPAAGAPAGPAAAVAGPVLWPHR